jgi:hypothetical protein
MGWLSSLPNADACPVASAAVWVMSNGRRHELRGRRTLGVARATTQDFAAMPSIHPG